MYLLTKRTPKLTWRGAGSRVSNGPPYVEIYNIHSMFFFSLRPTAQINDDLFTKRCYKKSTTDKCKSISEQALDLDQKALFNQSIFIWPCSPQWSFTKCSIHRLCGVKALRKPFLDFFYRAPVTMLILKKYCFHSVELYSKTNDFLNLICKTKSLISMHIACIVSYRYVNCGYTARFYISGN